jgi:hypothetical protein
MVCGRGEFCRGFGLSVGYAVWFVDAQVSVGGAPYLCKVDLKAFTGYTSSVSCDQLPAMLQDKFISYFIYTNLQKQFL